MTSQVRPVEQDSLGILNPGAMMRRVRLHRYPHRGRVDGPGDWFWAASWNLLDSVTHRQVLTHPGANLSVGNADADIGGVPPESIVAECHGVATRLSTRASVDAGWTVAALTTPGGLGVSPPRPRRRSPTGW